MVGVGVGNSELTAWFAEIDLDPEVPWLRMGTRQLGARPWLVADSRWDEELALKRRLCRQRHGEVFAAEPSALVPGREVLSLVRGALNEAGAQTAPDQSSDTGRLHPLDEAGRSIQEDLCLLRRDDVGWILAGASLCFPSRWRLAEKMGRPLADVHGPVEGYRSRLAGRVDSLFDRLGSRIVWRRNWFIHPDGSLFQPDRPAGGDPTIEADDCDRLLYLRSERQTIRRLPDSGWVLFTVRIQQQPLGRFLEDRHRLAAFRRFLSEAEPSHAAHRGLSTSQREALGAALSGR